MNVSFGSLSAAAALAERHAPFLRAGLRRHPSLVDDLAGRGLADVLADARAVSDADHDVAGAMRRERQCVALAVALADLAGAPLEAVTGALTDFADRALERAIAAAFAERGAAPEGFAAIALGKQGSRELNYSSDIDPILIFDPAKLPRRSREDPVEAAVRIARRIVALLQERTADGYVLRVDLRLRPAAEATPLAVPIDVAVSHYESRALPWERAAFIRARAVGGDVALGQAFLDHVRPFVWRRALDFGAVEDMRALSRRIRDHHLQGQQPGPGYDVKRGRGGIREIEFYTQIHQLIHGGRLPAVRAPATLDALAALAEAGLVAPGNAAMLGRAYRCLRTVEHRLQMMEDQQTHRLPRQPDLLDHVACLAGFADGAALIDRLAPQAEAVGALYDALDPPGGTPIDPEALVAEAAFADPEKVRLRIDHWREGQVRTMRNPVARAALETVLPQLIAALARAPSPDAALDRFDALVDRLPSALNLFRLLEARPALIDQLAAILSHAPALAAALSRNASLLDGLIDASAYAPAPSVERMIAAWRRGEPGESYEQLLDRVRRAVGEQRFELGVQLVTGQADPLAVGEGYARVAEAALDLLGHAAVAAFEQAHGRVPGGELVILALGRFGGGVMTHASDLDLIYLFTGDFLAESDGPRPLGATTYFQRLAQRVSAAMSVPTAAGPLYEIDTRLRPSGNQGLLAASVDSFARYQREGAWTWEHMALTRARPVFGSATARAAVQAVIDATLHAPRGDVRLRADATKMRGDIAANKPPAGTLDVKLIPGGLIDAEFAIHVLQLSGRIGFDPRLQTAAAALEEAGLLASGMGDAIALLGRMLIMFRLVAPDAAEPPPASRQLVAERCGRADWGTLMAAYDDARALVAGEWRRVSTLG